MPPKNLSPRAMLAAAIVALCWGGNYTATKLGIEDFPPMVLLILRFLGVSLVLAPFALTEKNKPKMRDMLFISFTLIVLQFAMIFTGLSMGLTVTSVIIATQTGVPFACVMAAIFFKDYLGPWRSFGLMVAFMGVVIVAGTPNAAEHWSAFLLVVMGSLSWSVANLYLKTIKQTPSMVALLFWPSALAIPFLIVGSYCIEHDQWQHIADAPLQGWLVIAYGIFFSSIIGYGLWNWLMTRHPVSQVMPYSLLMPLAGITIGMLTFHETMTLQIGLGAALTILGVAVISLRRPKLAEIEQ